VDPSVGLGALKKEKIFFCLPRIEQLPAEALATFPCKSHIFRKRIRKVIISEEK
jgi:hypothetical protein